MAGDRASGAGRPAGPPPRCPRPGISAVSARLPRVSCPSSRCLSAHGKLPLHLQMVLVFVLSDMKMFFWFLIYSLSFILMFLFKINLEFHFIYGLIWEDVFHFPRIP